MNFNSHFNPHFVVIFIINHYHFFIFHHNFFTKYINQLFNSRLSNIISIQHSIFHATIINKVIDLNYVSNLKKQKADKKNDLKKTKKMREFKIINNLISETKSSFNRIKKRKSFNNKHIINIELSNKRIFKRSDHKSSSLTNMLKNNTSISISSQKDQIKSNSHYLNFNSRKNRLLLISNLTIINQFDAKNLILFCILKQGEQTIQIYVNNTIINANDEHF